MAAVAIAVLRLDRAIQAASFRHVETLDLRAGTPEEALDRPWNELVARNRAIPPDALDWAIEMRNALLHRARHLSVFLIRSGDEDLAIDLPRDVARGRLRFDPYLRPRPWLPDMEQLAEDQGVGGWLEEPATQTLRGLFDTLNGFVEESVAWLGGLWSDFRAEVRPVPPSPDRWVFRPPPDPGFVGIAPARREDLAGAVVHPRTGERIALAMRVRAL